jgi:hypothetical protein
VGTFLIQLMRVAIQLICSVSAKSCAELQKSGKTELAYEESSLLGYNAV